MQIRIENRNTENREQNQRRIVVAHIFRRETGKTPNRIE